ncbi:MAG: T9SS type A sorting domain-containing protein [Flavobacteriales bacterium]
MNYSGISATRYYRAVLQNGSCGTAFSNVGIVTVYNFAASNSGPVCSGTTLQLGVTTTGGSGPFTFAWTGPNSFSSSLQNPSIDNIPANGGGTYSVTVSAPGCNSTLNTSVTVNASPSITAVTNNSRCGNGTVALSASASAGTISWFTASTGGSAIASGTAYTTPSISATTSYWVSSTSGSCTSPTRTEVIATVNQIPTVASSAGAARCGAGTVTLSATASAGVINWFSASSGGSSIGTGNSFTTPSISATTTYWAEASNNGCNSAARTAVVATINAVPSLGTAITNVACNGGANGVASVSPSGGVAPYTYSWSPSGGSAATATGLSVGNYVVTVTGSNGCSAQANITVTQPSALIANAASQTNVSCNGGSNGAASVSVSGGAGGYTYNWTPGNPTGDGTASVTGLTAGSWTCTVTDANGCTATRNFTITQPTALVASAQSQTNVSCNGGSNGAASVSVSGGAGGYTYNWTPGNPNGDGSASISGLGAGTYVCTVTDANGCIASQSFTISEPSILVVSAAAQTNVSCNGGNNGAASVIVSGGAGGYSFDWTGNPNGDGTASVSGLSAGNYVCTVTDANGCSASQSFEISEPSALVVSAASQTNVACNAGNNGAASVVVSGGAGDYTYDWTGNPDGDGTASITGLIAGTYECTVTDANGCIASQSFTISEPIAPVTISGNPVEVLCFGGNNGAINVDISGGTAGYSFLWSNGEITEDISSLIAGEYILTVTDANGCSANEAFLVNQPMAQLDAVIGTIDVTCFEGNDGSISVEAFGGTAPYVYNWANIAANTADVSNLEAGLYELEIIDANGCDISRSVEINQPVNATSSMDVTSCDSYSLNNETYTESGIYTQILQNAAGCDSTLTLNLTILESTFSSMDVTVCDSYSLNGETYTESGVYTQMLQNAAGCDSTLTLNLTILESTFSSMDVTVCDSYSLNGETYTESGMYTQMLQNAAGCDSTLTLNLTILESTFSSMDVTVCDSYSLNGETYTESGVYTQLLQNAAGCDSTLTLNLTILESTFSSMDVTVCDSYSLNGEIYTESGVYTQMLQNAAGCDSTLTLNLTILESTFSSMDVTVCDSYSLNGETYTESGVYIQMLQNAAGCDSTLTLNLTILESTFSNMEITACDSYSLNGETYTASGVYTQVLQNAAGCDSTLTLNLTILQSSGEELTIIACDSYTLYGQTYTESGVYTQQLENVVGCELNVTLNLTILESSSSVLDVAACDSYTLNGEVYTESGVYTQVIPNAAGCDSTITLNLNVAQSSFTNIDIIAFQAFELDGVVYSESGEYNFAYESIAGCDSLVTYNITITTLAGDTNGDGEIGDGEIAGDTDGDGEIGDGEVAGDTDGDGEIGDGEVSGDTDGDGEIGDGEVAGDDNGDGSLGCDESAALGLLTETMEMVSCGPYTFEGMMFNESGIYVEQYMNENGCPVQVTLHLEVIDLNLQINPVDGALVSLQGFGADFQWIDCATNTAIAGANGQWFAPSQSGEYALQIGLGECEATTECVEFIALNQEELGASVLQVFPNPSQGVFRVRMSGTTDMQYEVFDAQGSMIKAGRWTNSENELNLEGCSSGVYHLRMGEQVIRLIIQ